MANITDKTVFDILKGSFTNEFDKSERRDAFQLRKAKIVEILGPNDDRIRVRVLGLNTGVEDKDNLPCFFPFYQGTCIPGDVDDTIWVVCTSDCQQGYYLGTASIFSLDKNNIKNVSYSYNNLNKFLKERKICPDDFDYKNIVIDKCVMSENGGIIEGYNRKTGDWFLINSTGAMITVQQQCIYMRVGSPPDPITSGPVGFSSIEMRTDSIDIKTPNFNVDADKIVLGHHGLNLAAMSTSSPSVGQNGIPVIKIDNISV